jgi:hypothetical protein
MKKEKAITISASEIDGMKFDSFEINVLFQLGPTPMKLREGRMEWLKRQKIKPIKVEIKTVKDFENKH